MISRSVLILLGEDSPMISACNSNEDGVLGVHPHAIPGCTCLSPSTSVPKALEYLHSTSSFFATRSKNSGGSSSTALLVSATGVENRCDCDCDCLDGTFLLTGLENFCCRCGVKDPMLPQSADEEDVAREAAREQQRDGGRDPIQPSIGAAVSSSGGNSLVDQWGLGSMRSSLLLIPFSILRALVGVTALCLRR